MPHFPTRYAAFDLVPPMVPEALPLLADEHAYLIDRAHQLQPLKVSIPEKWQASTATLTLNFYWDDIWVGEEHLNDPDPSLFPLVFEVPGIDLSRAGVYALRYEVVLDTELGQRSHPQWVNIDKEAPNQGSPGPTLQLPPEVIADGLTDEYLALHGSMKAAINPAWLDIRLQDKVIVHWTRLSGASTDETVLAEFEQVIETEADKQTPIEVVFPETFLRANGNGHFGASYSLQDRAGNRGPESSVAVLDVSLSVPPSALLAPRIPQAQDGQIDRADACATVQVLLDGYREPMAGDQLLVTFNSSVLAPVPAPGVGGFPVSVEVPWDILKSYGETASYQAVVYWRVQRGAFISRPSQTLAVEVDLRVAGPANPSPCPLNGRLPRVTVKGLSADNVVGPIDAPGPVPVQVLLYENPRPGEVLNLYWDSLPVPVASYPVAAGDSAGQLVTFEVDWDDILAAGFGAAVPVWYSVSNGINLQHSPQTACRVEEPGEVPGGGDKLKVGYFPNTNANQALNYQLTRGGALYRIELDYPQAAVGDELVMCLQGYTPDGATQLPGTEYTAQDRVDAVELAQGYYQFLVPEQKFTRAMYPGPRNLVKVAYQASNASGTGESLVSRNWIDMRGEGNGGSDLLVLSVS